MDRSTKQEPSPVAAPLRLTRAWPWACALIAIGLVAYSNSFWGPFVFDDNSSIVVNPEIRQLSPITGWFKSNRGLCSLTFALNFAVGGLDVRGYHVVNLLIHLVAGLALFGLTSRTFVRWPLTERYGKAARPLAFSIALLWLVHPLQTESVTYIAQRYESLVGLCLLLTLYAFARAADADRPWVWYCLSLLACAAGMRVKEVMIAAPLLVVWYDRAFVARSWKEVFSRKAYYAGLAVVSILLMGPILRHVTAIITPQLASATPTEQSDYPVQFDGGAWVKGMTPRDYLVSQPGVILNYLRVVFHPAAQCFDYAWPVAATPSQIWPATIVILCLFALTLASIWKYPAASFLGGWFFFILAPSSSIVPVKDLAAEHRMYLPLAAVLALVVIAGYELWRAALNWQATGQQKSGLVNWLGPVLMLIAVLALAWQTWLRNIDYQSNLRLWQDTAEKAPHNARAHYSIAQDYLEQNDYVHAIEAADTCVSKDPTYAAAYHVRGVAKAEQKDLQAAIDNFSECVKQEPKYFKGFHDRGLAYQMLGQLELALADFNQLVKLAPVPRSYLARANALALHSDHRLAIDDLNQALQMNPLLAEGYRMRAESLFELGEYAAAWEDVRLCRSFGGSVAPEFLQKLNSRLAEPGKQ